MKILLDTNALIWATEDEGQLTSKARLALSDPNALKAVSVVAFWEMEIKTSLGKLILGMAPHILMESLLATDGIEVLNIRSHHFRCLSTLPHHHKDPFDRLMIAQALEEGWSVVSSDEQWDAYGIHRIW